jgi:hypothetical protein
MKPDFLKPKVASIPVELKKFPQWVCWEIKKRNGKWTKAPHCPNTGKLASTTDPNTWGQFFEAYREYSKNGKYAGVGFVLSKNDPFVGFDFDHSWGRLGATAAVAPILQQLNSYAEISPSGKGLRAFAKGNIPSYGRKKGPIEIYADGRFLTVTGHIIPGAANTIENRPAEIKKIHQEIFGKQKQKKLAFEGLPEVFGKKPDIQKVLDKAFKSKNGERVKALFDGDIGGYPSQSEADLALCCHLAYWFKDKAEAVDQAFRESGLMRPKWDSKRGSSAYGWQTIEKAIEAAEERTAIQNEPVLVPDPQDDHGGGPDVQNGQLEEAGAQSGTPEFPPTVMSGLAGYFTQIYGSHLEPPEQFFYMSYLALLGLAVGHKLTLSSQRRYRPNFYMVLLGESGKTRKSTAIEETVGFFTDALADKCFTVCRGAASGEALGKKFEENLNVLLYYDELKVFVNKANIQNSTLLSAVNILFETTRYENFKTKDPLIIDNAHLSVIAASTTDTYAEMFSPKYLDIGFNNRLFLVPGDSDKCIPVPLPIPADETKFMKKELGDCLKLIDKNPVVCP